MVEKTDRTATEAGPRSADGRRFEVFVREEDTDPLRHVGTVAAPTPGVAHEEASKLFAWYARDVWVCPAEETHRYSADALGDDERDPTVTRDAGEPRGDGDPEEGGEPRADDEPRVYEETEGTPTAGGAQTEETPTAGGAQTEETR